MIAPSTRVRAAWILAGATVVAWPATALTVFAEEPQGILGLSYFAIILTALNIVATTDVRSEQDSDTDELSRTCRNCGCEQS